MVGAALTLGAAAEGLRKKTFSSVELTQSVLAAIREKDGALNAYLSVDEAGALQQAAAADAARAAGRDGDLLGIPVAVKDLINVAGQPCSCASKMLAGYVAPYDATVSARLRAVGAVFAGRTNMDEFAMGSSTEGSAFKTTRNPCDLTRVPGGSSGGSAAAVAGGEAVAALGTDTGGSIRQPAAFCGCVGLKPSYGRVSRYGVTAYASSLDQVGPLTRTVEDAAVLLQALAGVDPRDGTTLDAPVPDYRASLRDGLKGMRIGLPREYYIDGTDPEVMACVRRTVDACAAAGAEIVEVSLPHTEYAIAAYYIVATAEASANLARFDGVRYGHRTAHPESVFDLYAQSRAEGFGTEVKRRIILGTYVLSSARKKCGRSFGAISPRRSAAATCCSRRWRPRRHTASARRAMIRSRCIWAMFSRCRPTWPASAGSRSRAAGPRPGCLSASRSSGRRSASARCCEPGIRWKLLCGWHDGQREKNDG